MKTFLKISCVLFLLLVTSCHKAPEKKMLHVLNQQEFFHSKFLSVEVLDTIFQKEVDSVMTLDQNKLDSIKASVRAMRSMLSDMRKNKDAYAQQEFDSTARIGFHFLRQFEQEMSWRESRMHFYEQIDLRQNANNTAAYKINVITKKDTDEFIIKKDYSFLCSSFILEDNRTNQRYKSKNIRNKLKIK